MEALPEKLLLLIGEYVLVRNSIRDLKNIITSSKKDAEIFNI